MKLSDRADTPKHRLQESGKKCAVVPRGETHLKTDAKTVVEVSVLVNGGHGGGKGVWFEKMERIQTYDASCPMKTVHSYKKRKTSLSVS